MTINSLAPIVTIFILVGVLLGAGLMILGQMESATWVSTSGSTSLENIASLSDNASAPSTLTALNKRGPTCVITNVTNATNGKIVLANATGYTATTAADGCGLIASSADFTGEPVNVTYTYVYSADSIASNGSEDVANATVTIASTWIPVIIVVIAAGIVLGILLGAFGGGKRK